MPRKNNEDLRFDIINLIIDKIVTQAKKEFIKMIEKRIGELSSDDSVKSYINCGHFSNEYKEIMTRINELEILKGDLG